MLQRLREQVLEANLELVRRGLVLYTFGNASGISREQSLVVIKPSGVPYEADETRASGGHGSRGQDRGRQTAALLRSSHSSCASIRPFPKLAASPTPIPNMPLRGRRRGEPIPCFGTTHADYFHGPVPVTSEMTDQEIAGEYEKNTGHAIVRCL